ncbi:unnamed protein product [Sphagnum balticum]
MNPLMENDENKLSKSAESTSFLQRLFNTTRPKLGDKRTERSQSELTLARRIRRAFKWQTSCRSSAPNRVLRRGWHNVAVAVAAESSSSSTRASHPETDANSTSSSAGDVPPPPSPACRTQRLSLRRRVLSARSGTRPNATKAAIDTTYSTATYFYRSEKCTLRAVNSWPFDRRTDRDTYQYVAVTAALVDDTRASTPTAKDKQHSRLQAVLHSPFRRIQSARRLMMLAGKHVVNDDFKLCWHCHVMREHVMNRRKSLNMDLMDDSTKCRSKPSPPTQPQSPYFKRSFTTDEGGRYLECPEIVVTDIECETPSTGPGLHSANDQPQSTRRFVFDLLADASSILISGEMDEPMHIFNDVHSPSTSGRDDSRRSYTHDRIPNS